MKRAVTFICERKCYPSASAAAGDRKAPPPVPPRVTSPVPANPAPVPAAGAAGTPNAQPPNGGLLPTGAALAAEPDTKPRRAEREAEMSLETHLRGVAMTLINALISEQYVFPAPARGFGL